MIAVVECRHVRPIRYIYARAVHLIRSGPHMVLAALGRAHAEQHEADVAHDEEEGHDAPDSKLDG